MNKILNPRKYVMFIIWVLVIIFIMINVLLGDRSYVQSEQVIEIALMPCEVMDGKQVEVEYFKTNSFPHICGRVLSKYLPLELYFVLTNEGSGERVYYEVKKIFNHDFLIELPKNLEIGKYEFKITDGRDTFQTVYFEVIE